MLVVASSNAAPILSPNAENCDAIPSVWSCNCFSLADTAAAPWSMPEVFAPNWTWTSSAITSPHADAGDLAARRGHVPLHLLERHVSRPRRQVEVLRRQVPHGLRREHLLQRDSE